MSDVIRVWVNGDLYDSDAPAQKTLLEPLASRVPVPA